MMSAAPATPVRPAPAAAPAVSAPAIYSVLQLGDTHVALPLDVLREAVPCPAQFSGLPASAPGLLGAFNLRGRIVPVLDLRPVLGVPAPRSGSQVIVLMRHNDALLGLLVDSVCGLTQLQPGAFNTIACDSRTLLFSGSFERAEDGTVVSVLNPAAVMDLPGLPLLRDEPPARHDGAGAQAAAAALARRHPLMLVRCGHLRLAMDVTEIHATLPEVALQPSSMDGPICRGVIDYAGVRLPAVDPLALLELGRLPDGVACQALLLRCPGGLVALLVSQVIDILSVPQADLLALPALAVRRPALFRAALPVPGHGDHLVLARGALQAEPSLLALATLNAPASSPSQRAGTRSAVEAAAASALGQSAGGAVLTYDIGAEVATRLMQVLEVLPLPAHFSQPFSTHPAVMGLFTHRGQTVPLVCLSTLLEGSTRPERLQARVLLVHSEGAHFGFVVPRLCHIENTVWEQPPQSGSTDARVKSGAPSLMGHHSVVELRTNGQRRTLHLVDLKALARELQKGAGAATGPEETAAVSTTLPGA